MHPRYKMLGIHTIIFLGVFLLIRLILEQFMEAPNAMLIILPLGLAWLIAPRPHVVQMQSGKQYGLKFLFAKKVYKM